MWIHCGSERDDQIHYELTVDFHMFLYGFHMFYMLFTLFYMFFHVILLDFHMILYVDFI